MSDVSSSPDQTRPTNRRTIRLWHLVVAVFASALVLAMIRSLDREVRGVAAGGVSALALSAVSVAISFGFIHVGKVLGGWITRGLMERSVRRGGVLGFFGWLVGIGLNVAYVLVAIVVGPVATLAIAYWLVTRVVQF